MEMKAGIRVLIADDSDLMRMVMKGFFKKFLDNAIISETTNLKDTFELLNQTEFDFLLLDINMPKEDSSPETIRKVHAIQPQIKVCMFTGNDKATLQEQYKDAGAIGFIQKDEHMGISIDQVLKKAFN